MIDSNVIQELNAYKLKEDLSWEGVAKKIGGISGSSLNLLVNNKYPTANTGKIETKIKQFLGREKQKRKLPVIRIPFIETYNSQMVFAAAIDAHSYCSINVVTSDPGQGKTISIKEYVKKNAGTIFIEALPNMSAKVLFQEILAAFNITFYAHMSGMFKEAVSHLKDSGRLIAVDEAESLSHGALEYLRRLHDITKDINHVPTIGVLLLGDKRLTSNLRGYQNKYKRLFSRAGWNIELPPYSEEDTTAIFKSIYPDADEDICDTIYKLARGSGRAVEMIIKNIKRLQLVNNKPVSVKLAQAAAKEIML
jgi:DNA transposition AAA+ family ATPase